MANQRSAFYIGQRVRVTGLRRKGTIVHAEWRSEGAETGPGTWAYHVRSDVTRAMRGNGLHVGPLTWWNETSLRSI